MEGLAYYQICNVTEKSDLKVQHQAKQLTSLHATNVCIYLNVYKTIHVHTYMYIAQKSNFGGNESKGFYRWHRRYVHRNVSKLFLCDPFLIYQGLV